MTERVAGNVEEPRAAAVSRRDDLLSAAVQVFSEKGYDAASVDAVAKAANIRKPSVYKHVRSKEDLLMGILDRAHEQSMALWAEVEQLDDPPIVRLHSYLVSHVLWYLDNVELLNVFFREWRSVTTPERRELIAERRRGYDRLMRQLIAECQGSGAADPSLDVKYVSFFALGAVNTTPDWFRHQEAGDTAAAVARDTADLVVNMITIGQAA